MGGIVFSSKNVIRSSILAYRWHGGRDWSVHFAVWMANDRVKNDIIPPILAFGCHGGSDVPIVRSIWFMGEIVVACYNVKSPSILAYGCQGSRKPE
jgi:hypothetical protein